MKTKMLSAITKALGKTSFKMKKHSPEILTVAGVVCTAAGTIMACKATLKVDTILDEHKDTVEKIHKCEEEKTTEVYSQEDAKKDLTTTYVQTGVKFVKLYAPSVALCVLGVTSLLTSNHILRKRNLALAAAYTTIDTAFKEYRGRVVERFGDTVDRELRYNLKAEKIEEQEIDEETGKKKKVKKDIHTISSKDVSGYARLFEQYNDAGEINPNWETTPEYNLMFIKAQERYVNGLLVAKGRVFLNEVYKCLGFSETKEGQIVGWVYDEKNPVGDNYIDFGLYRNNDIYYMDYEKGKEHTILLDFNVDGNIWELM